MIMLKNPFRDQIKRRKETKIFYLKKENREGIKNKIKILFK